MRPHCEFWLEQGSSLGTRAIPASSACDSRTLALTKVICRQQTIRSLLELAILVLGGVLTTLAQAQQTAPSQPGTNLTPQDLAKSVHNPFEDFLKVPLSNRLLGLASGRITTQEKALTFSQ